MRSLVRDDDADRRRQTSAAASVTQEDDQRYRDGNQAREEQPLPLNRLSILRHKKQPEKQSRETRVEHASRSEADALSSLDRRKQISSAAHSRPPERHNCSSSISSSSRSSRRQRERKGDRGSGDRAYRVGVDGIASVSFLSPAAAAGASTSEGYTGLTYGPETQDERRCTRQQQQQDRPQTVVRSRCPRVTSCPRSTGETCRRAACLAQAFLFSLSLAPASPTLLLLGSQA